MSRNQQSRQSRRKAGTLHKTSGSENIVIAVMGMTGVGKSSFIKTVTGDENIVIGEGLESGVYQDNIVD